MVAGSSPDEVDFFILPNPFSRAIGLESTQPLTEASTRNISGTGRGGIKGGRRVGITTLPQTVSRLSRQNVGARTSHKPMGLHGLLQR
jgi:hypothetical protein